MSIVPPSDPTRSVLVADPSDHNRRSIIEALPLNQFDCIEAKDGLTAWTHYLQHRPIALLTAVDLLGIRATELLHRVRAHSSTAFALHTTVNDARVAATFMRAGADDFFLLPDEVSTIASRLSDIIASNLDRPNPHNLESIIVGQSRSIARLREKLIGVSALRIPILFRAEPGAGADHAARTLANLAPDLAPDAQRAFTPLRPGSMRPPQKQDCGRIVYLDRIDRLSFLDQGQWLNQIKKCERGDADAPHRIIASTSADLQQFAASGRFDPDLAQRLAQFSITIPPLRERVEDIGLLARHLASETALEMGRRPMIVTTPATRLLQMQPWPENVRELRLVVEQLVAFSTSRRITRDCVQRILFEARCGVRSMRLAREQKSRDELVAVLDATGGNLAEAARRMGMSRGAVIYRAQKFGLLARRVRGRA